MAFACLDCGSEPGAVPTCPDCGGFVAYERPSTGALESAVDGDRWAALPPVEPAARVDLGEGGTPQLPLAATDGDIRAKLESMNPTCSFKDRGSALVVAAIHSPSTSFEGVVVASTGNTATSVAAYAARADVPCAILVPEGTSTAKLSQAAAHGADVFTVDGTFSDCFELARSVADERVVNATAVYSANPYVEVADRTVAHEIVAALGTAPDWVSVPVGAGPLLGGVYRGFRDLRAAGLVDEAPSMLCVQARGCHPIVSAYEAETDVEPWTEPITTDVGAIADPLVGYAADGQRTLEAVRESDGDAVALSDETIHAWHGRLAEREGIYAEPASAASVAAIAESDRINDDATSVALITGHGLKEPDAGDPPSTSPADQSRIRDLLVG